ncbi:MAG TPA: hypothetical protein VKT72_12950 [Candidatus Baltobacteraceae bacterium]|nr:hypothetical protein [Candidatus Baltobacteraceae bacterium]
MKNQLRTAAAAIGLLLAASLPAVSQTQPKQYDTALTELYGSAAPYTGTLKLTVSPDGIVRGYYFPSDGTALFIPVTGGQTGQSIWFDIGNGDMYHVDARVLDGSIIGTAVTHDNAQYTFVAKPES